MSGHGDLLIHREPRLCRRAASSARWASLNVCRAPQCNEPRTSGTSRAWVGDGLESPLPGPHVQRPRRERLEHGAQAGRTRSRCCASRGGGSRAESTLVGPSQPAPPRRCIYGAEPQHPRLPAGGHTAPTWNEQFTVSGVTPDSTVVLEVSSSHLGALAPWPSWAWAHRSAPRAGAQAEHLQGHPAGLCKLGAAGTRRPLPQRLC
jgi:hypothetical protein